MVGGEEVGESPRRGTHRSRPPSWGASEGSLTLDVHPEVTLDSASGVLLSDPTCPQSGSIILYRPINPKEERRKKMVFR